MKKIKTTRILYFISGVYGIFVYTVMLIYSYTLKFETGSFESFSPTADTIKFIIKISVVIQSIALLVSTIIIFFTVFRITDQHLLTKALLFSLVPSFSAACILFFLIIGAFFLGAMTLFFGLGIFFAVVTPAIKIMFFTAIICIPQFVLTINGRNIFLSNDY